MNTEDYQDEWDDEDDEMPVVCDCGKVFDLQEGYASLTSNQTVCKECHEDEEREERIEELKCEIQSFLSDIKWNISELEKLGDTEYSALINE